MKTVFLVDVKMNCVYHVLIRQKMPEKVIQIVGVHAKKNAAIQTHAKKEVTASHHIATTVANVQIHLPVCIATIVSLMPTTEKLILTVADSDAHQMELCARQEKSVSREETARVDSAQPRGKVCRPQRLWFVKDVLMLSRMDENRTSTVEELRMSRTRIGVQLSMIKVVMEMEQEMTRHGWWLDQR